MSTEHLALLIFIMNIRADPLGAADDVLKCCLSDQVYSKVQISFPLIFILIFIPCILKEMELGSEDAQIINKKHPL